MSSEKPEVPAPESAAAAAAPRRAWVFPSVGVKPSGFETALAQRFPHRFREAFDRTAAHSGRQLLPALLDNDFTALDGLDEQLFNFSFAAAMAGLVESHFGPPELAAGNSFGAYPAVWAAGALDWEDSLDVLTSAYRFMQAAAARQPGNLCAVVGLSLADLDGIIRDAGLGGPAGGNAGSGAGAAGCEAVLRINSNNDSCHIFCGPQAGIASLERLATDMGAINVAVLPLALPYHHPAYHPDGGAGFRAVVEALDWREPRFPLVSTLDRGRIGDRAGLVDFIARQVFEPIDWAAVVTELYRLGMTEIFECGPGMALTQNARFVAGEAQWQNSRSLAKRLPGDG